MREIQPDDRLSRFLVSDRLYATTTGRVKPRAFIPWSEDGKTSVFRTTGALEHDVWSVADLWVAPHRGKSPGARGDLRVITVVQAGLDVEIAEPPPEHCNIIGWPVEKFDVMSCAQQLAAGATLVMR